MITEYQVRLNIHKEERISLLLGSEAQVHQTQLRTWVRQTAGPHFRCNSARLGYCPRICTSSWLPAHWLAAGWRTILVCIHHMDTNYYSLLIRYTGRGMVLSSSQYTQQLVKGLLWFVRVESFPCTACQSLKHPLENSNSTLAPGYFKKPSSNTSSQLSKIRTDAVLWRVKMYSWLSLEWLKCTMGY